LSIVSAKFLAAVSFEAIAPFIIFASPFSKVVAKSSSCCFDLSVKPFSA
jgi:hypothetical protein